MDIFEPTYCITTPYLGNPIQILHFPAAAPGKQLFPSFCCSLKKNWKQGTLDPGAIQLCRLAAAATVKVYFTLLYLHTFNQVCIPWCQAQKVRDGWDEKGKYGQERSYTLPFSKLNLHPYPSGFGHGKQKL